jgi:hypothetical protein
MAGLPEGRNRVIHRAGAGIGAAFAREGATLHLGGPTATVGLVLR